jgi:predicted dienelactone hydrolase
MKIKRTFLLIASMLPSLAVANIPGHQSFSIVMPHHNGQPMQGNIFYPTMDKKPESLFGKGSTFQKISIIENAAIPKGTFPLMIYSHDWDGGLGPQSWIVADLATRGAITVHIDHKYSLWGANNVKMALYHWKRVQDIQEAINYVLTSGRFGPLIDRSKIMVVGFGEGGLTALTAGGLTANLDGVVNACAKHQDKMRYCDQMMSPKIDLASYDKVIWNASYKIDSVSSVAVIEPSLVHGLKHSDTSNLVNDVTLFSFKNGSDYDYASDIDVSGLATVLPNATRVNFNPAYRFSAALKCNPGVEEKLMKEERFPICTDPSGSDRDTIHKQIIDTLASKLGLK